MASYKIVKKFDASLIGYALAAAAILFFSNISISQASVEIKIIPQATGSVEAALVKTQAASPRNDVKGVKNFAKISEDLYRGEQPDAEGFGELKKMGIKTIVSFRAFHSDRSMLKGLGLYYRRIPFNTWHAEDEDVVKFLKIIKNKKYSPVFIHCQHGSDRTGTMCAIYRMAFHNWTVKDAIAEMRNFGFHEIWQNLIDYLNGVDVKKLMKEADALPEFKIDLVE